MRWRLEIAYDGTEFFGFAEQPGQRTVVGELRRVLARTCRLVEPPLVVGAGRTDRGVHAYAQVVHVDLPDPLFPDDRGDPTDRLRRSLNGQLGGAITVRRMILVDPSFHARFSATERPWLKTTKGKGPSPAGR